MELDKHTVMLCLLKALSVVDLRADRRVLEHLVSRCTQGGAEELERFLREEVGLSIDDVKRVVSMFRTCIRKELKKLRTEAERRGRIQPSILRFFSSLYGNICKKLFNLSGSADEVAEQCLEKITRTIRSQKIVNMLIDKLVSMLKSDCTFKLKLPESCRIVALPEGLAVKCGEDVALLISHSGDRIEFVLS